MVAHCGRCTAAGSGRQWQACRGKWQQALTGRPLVASRSRSSRSVADHGGKLQEAVVEGAAGAVQRARCHSPPRPRAPMVGLPQGAVLLLARCVMSMRVVVC